MRSLLPILALFASAPFAAAQSFNIDVGDNLIIFPTPQNTYVGAANQAGTWNDVHTPYTSSLLKLDGSPSTVTTSSTTTASYNYFPSTLTGDDRNLMIDIQDLPFIGGPWSWTFNGLQDGDYVLYTYAWAPENTGFQTHVDVPTSTDPAQDIGGFWSGSPHVQGVTYAVHHLTVVNNTFSVLVDGVGGHDGSINGFQLVQVSTSPASIYCTAKVNSIGCTPAIGFSGTPSATAGSGFLITATNQINNKNGLLFYSTQGANGIPFQGGTLCVKAPIKRTAVQNSGGNAPPNDCSGTYSLDFNTYIASGVNPNLISGQQVNAQYWSRDPGFAPPNNTGLSDAVEFVIGP